MMEVSNDMLVRILHLINWNRAENPRVSGTVRGSNVLLEECFFTCVCVSLLIYFFIYIFIFLFFRVCVCVHVCLSLSLSVCLSVCYSE
jgi:hypothetical protein